MWIRQRKVRQGLVVLLLGVLYPTVGLGLVVHLLDVYGREVLGFIAPMAMTI